LRRAVFSHSARRVISTDSALRSTPWRFFVTISTQGRRPWFRQQAFTRYCREQLQAAWRFTQQYLPGDRRYAVERAVYGRAHFRLQKFDERFVLRDHVVLPERVSVFPDEIVADFVRCNTQKIGHIDGMNLARQFRLGNNGVCPDPVTLRDQHGSGDWKQAAFPVVYRPVVLQYSLLFTSL